MAPVENLPGEEWRPAPSAPGVEASSLGRVRGPIGVMKQHDNGWGYVQVRLARRGPGCRRLVHLLVLEAFVGPKPAGMEALHGPEGKGVNAIRNLRYGTHKENVAEHNADRRANPGKYRPKKCMTPRVAAVVPLLGTMPDTEISRRTGVSQPHLCELRKRLGIPAFGRHPTP